jgi:hypothetical protein
MAKTIVKRFDLLAYMYVFHFTEKIPIINLTLECEIAFGQSIRLTSLTPSNFNFGGQIFLTFSQNPIANW